MYQRVPGVHRDLALPDDSCSEVITELCVAAMPPALQLRAGNALANTPGACAIHVVDTPVRSVCAAVKNQSPPLLLLERDGPP